MKTEVAFETRQGRTLSRRKEFFEDGTLFREGLYSKSNGNWSWDVPIGTVRTFNSNGTLKSEEHYDEAGTLEGESNFYDKEGKILKKVVYKNGAIIEEEDFQTQDQKKSKKE